MEATRKVTPEIDILPTSVQLPGLGFVPVNAFVLKAKEPVLIDTSLPAAATPGIPVGAT